MKSYLRNTSLPRGQALTDVVEGFKTKWGMIQCAGSIDGCHIPIMPPAHNHTDYYNRKGWYSMLLQAVVDHDYLFTDMCSGWPGSVHDARVCVNSAIHMKASQKEILDGESIKVHGTNIPIFLIGDSAYPQSTWLMKPFPYKSNLTRDQQSFNRHISRAHIVVETAFCRLKARWQRLSKRNDMNIENVPNVIAACCILHNVCEVHGDTFNNHWLEYIDQYAQPEQSSPPGGSNVATPNSSDIRDALVKYYSV